MRDRPTSDKRHVSVMRRTPTSANARSAQEVLIVDARRPDNWKKSKRCAPEDTTDIRPERKVMLANTTHLQTSDGLVVSCAFGLSISIGGLLSHAALSKRQFRRQTVEQTTSSAEASPTAVADLITQRITKNEDVSSTELTPVIQHRRVQQDILTEKFPTTERGSTPTGQHEKVDVEDLSGQLMSMSLLPK